MRKQIAAANWKMNKTVDEGKSLLKEILNADIHIIDNTISTSKKLFSLIYPILKFK